MNARLGYWLGRPVANEDLKGYFQGSDPEGLFTGRLFEVIGDGGDRPDRANVVDAEDLVAVQMLSVSIPPEVSADLLKGSLGNELSVLLSAIPSGVSLGDEQAATHIADDSPANAAWQLLRADGSTGMGTAKISKLLARKRPKLLPVYDGVVRCAVGAPANWWTSLHAFLADPGLGAKATIERLRKEAGVPDRVSDLRIVDVVVWMGHEKDHRKSRCNFSPPSASD